MTPSEDIDPQDVIDLANLNAVNGSATFANHTPAARLRNTVAAASNETESHIDASSWTCDCCKDIADVDTMWSCVQCNDVKVCTPCYYDQPTLRNTRHSQHNFVEHAEHAATVTPKQVAQPTNLQAMEKQRKKTERENYGVRHTSYDNLGEGGKRERDGLIAGVQANWRLKLDDPSAFWPETLAPTSDGATLQLRHVSSSLLRELRPLSEATKGNIATAHRAMSEALANRLRRTGEKRKLIAEDLKEALRLCKTVRKRPRHEQVGQGAEQGPSSKRARRSGCISTEQPVSPVIESSTPAAQSHAAPSHHAEPQIPEDIHDSSTESDVEDAAVEPPEDLAHTSGVDGVEQSHNQVPTPPLSPEVLSHVWRRHRDTPVSQSVEISTDTDWSQKFEGLREPFYLMCMKADTVSKGKLVVTFSVDGGRPNAA